MRNSKFLLDLDRISLANLPFHVSNDSATLKWLEANYSTRSFWTKIQFVNCSGQYHGHCCWFKLYRLIKSSEEIASTNVEKREKIQRKKKSFWIDYIACIHSISHRIKSNKLLLNVHWSSSVFFFFSFLTWFSNKHLSLSFRDILFKENSHVWFFIRWCMKNRVSCIEQTFSFFYFFFVSVSRLLLLFGIVCCRSIRRHFNWFNIRFYRPCTHNMGQKHIPNFFSPLNSFW